MADTMNRQDNMIQDLSSRLNLVFLDNGLKNDESKSDKSQFMSFCSL